MCGSTSAQRDINKQQTDFMKQLMGQYTADYGHNQAIMADLTKSLSPIVDAGPNQEGFSPAEKAALNTQAMESSSAGYQQASQAVNEKMMARGGGQMLPSGAEAQVNAGIASQAERELSSEKLDIANKDYATGRQNYFAAQGALAGVPTAMEHPMTGEAGAVIGSSDAAAQEANAIQKAGNSWMGLIGGLASTAIGGFTGGFGGGSKGGINVDDLPNNGSGIYNQNYLTLPNLG